MATLQRRLDAGGVTDLTMSPQGTNRILLQMPGITEEERKVIRKTLETTAQLEIRLAHPQTSPELINRISEGDDLLRRLRGPLSPMMRRMGRPPS